MKRSHLVSSCAWLLIGSLLSPSLSAQKHPSIDGVGNNQSNPEWGAAGQPLLRLFAPDYGDGLGTPGGSDRPSAREVTNAIGAQVSDMPNSLGASSFVWQWGQFIDHDIDLSDGADPAEDFPIAVPSGDAWFDPRAAGDIVMHMNRSAAISDDDGVRQQVNSITSFLDGSMVYGSDTPRALALLNADGSLKTSAGNLLPFNEAGFPNAPTSRDPALFLAGDVRCNEQLGLTAMHTLFVREHNFIVEGLKARESDPLRRYKIARSFVMSEIQAITFNEFLPTLLGPNAIPAYSGYDASVRPDVANEFSTAVYRIGHSMLPSELLTLDSELNSLPNGPVALRDAFFTPASLPAFGIDPFLRGLATQQAQEIDTRVIDDIRNFLFGEPGHGGFDLGALNVQRGRDHGLASYNTARVGMGLPAVTTFAEINPGDPDLTDALAALYASVDDIDLWAGALSEPHVNGGMVGETAFAILADQFTRLRDGDRYWYENRFSPVGIARINAQTLSTIIKRNTGIGDELQDNVFLTVD